MFKYGGLTKIHYKTLRINEHVSAIPKDLYPDVWIKKVENRVRFIVYRLIGNIHKTQYIFYKVIFKGIG